QADRGHAEQQRLHGDDRRREAASARHHDGEGQSNEHGDQRGAHETPPPSMLTSPTRASSPPAPNSAGTRSSRSLACAVSPMASAAHSASSPAAVNASCAGNPP